MVRKLDLVGKKISVMGSIPSVLPVFISKYCQAADEPRPPSAPSGWCTSSVPSALTLHPHHPPLHSPSHSPPLSAWPVCSGAVLSAAISTRPPGSPLRSVFTANVPLHTLTGDILKSQKPEGSELDAPTDVSCLTSPSEFTQKIS